MRLRSRRATRRGGRVPVTAAPPACWRTRCAWSTTLAARVAWRSTAGAATTAGPQQLPLLQVCARPMGAPARNGCQPRGALCRVTAERGETEARGLLWDLLERRAHTPDTAAQRPRGPMRAETTPPTKLPARAERRRTSLSTSPLQPTRRGQVRHVQLFHIQLFHHM